MPNDSRVPLVLVVFAALLLPRWATADSLLMVYVDKPPYSFLDKGVEKGFLLERTRRVLSRAGVESRFREMPPKRILREIQNNAQAICSFGWYKLAEREKFALFSAPLHQDRPQAVLAGPHSAAAVRRHASLKQLMSDGALILATAEGFSYGQEIDLMIAAFPGRIDRTVQSELQVARKIAAQRADFMFIDQEDYEFLSEADADFRGNGLVRIEYPDMPPGLKRYILCSQKVGADVMRRIDASIALEGKY